MFDATVHYNRFFINSKYRSTAKEVESVILSQVVSCMYESSIMVILAVSHGNTSMRIRGAARCTEAPAMCGSREGSDHLVYCTQPYIVLCTRGYFQDLNP